MDEEYKLALATFDLTDVDDANLHFGTMMDNRMVG